MKTNEDISFSRIALILVFAFLLGLGIIGYLNYITPPRTWQWGCDFYSFWMGSSLAWQGQSPYTNQAGEQINLLVFGRLLTEGDPQLRFFYPAYVEILLLPLLSMPIELATLVWCAASFAILATVSIVPSQFLIPRPSPWLLGILAISGIFFRPALITILLGQFALIILALCALSLWLASKDHDFWAGVILAFMTVKPSIGLFAPAALIVWSLRWRRRNILIGFAITLLLLFSISVYQVGWWVPDFVRVIQGYGGDAAGPNLGWTPRSNLTIPGLISLIGATLLLGIGFRRCFLELSLPWSMLMASLYLNLILTPHAHDCDLTLLLFPLFWLGREWFAKNWGLATLIILLWTPWLGWVAVTNLGGSLDDFRTGVWQFYPLALLIVTLIWLSWAKIESQVDSRALSARKVSPELRV